MKNKNIIWIILLLIGVIPFAICLGFCFISSITSKTMSFFDYLIFYSFLYWPTYVIGIILTTLAVIKIKKDKL